MIENIDRRDIQFFLQTLNIISVHFNNWVKLVIPACLSEGFIN